MEQTKEHFIQVASPQQPARDVFRITLQWHNLTLKLSAMSPSTKQLEGKQILTNSTLMDCISGRNTAADGSITANGVQWSKKLKHFSSYVRQDDMFYATITGREQLLYQARLRMGARGSTRSASTRCSNWRERDARSSPPSTSHRPSSSHYLLCDGATVYNGEAVAYFAELGYQCPGFVNPTDYFMRQLVVLGREKGRGRSEATPAAEGRVGTERCRLGGRPKCRRARRLDGGRRQWRGRLSGQTSRPLGANAGFSRNVLRLVRDRISFRANFFLQLFISAIVGLIYLQLDIDQTGIQNFAVFMPFVFFIPTYFLVGISHGFVTYISLQLFVVLLNFGAVGVGYMVSCLCRRVEIAPIVGIVYISPIKYGYEGMMKVFWKEIDTIPCASGQSCIARTGQEVLEYYSMDSLSVEFDGVMLLVLGVVFRFVGLVALWFNVRSKN
ncbi:hypothetical protein PHYPSEUDO_001453 [Phytophthora pseudosyringae]|uniref:ABC-2 type transporter domain-containing protein n=1 Tax=Phytophthora pseudosyringae TaxID=221518 RepID=A0A8T1W008_9STRA|nr:hypothetical protein PHYPSEUDO_001453 [Phytophthora pseudosyringae]